MPLIERTYADGQFTAAATLGDAEAFEFKGKSLLAFRSVTDGTITMYSSRTIDGEYTKAKFKNNAGDIVAVEVELADNEWVTVDSESAVYKFCKFLTSSGTAVVEYLQLG